MFFSRTPVSDLNDPCRRSLGRLSVHVALDNYLNQNSHQTEKVRSIHAALCFHNMRVIATKGGQITLFCRLSPSSMNKKNCGTKLVLRHLMNVT